MQEVKNYITEEVEEEIYADVLTTATTYKTAIKGTIPDGYEGVVVGLAVSRDETIYAYLKKKDKHVYTDGLNCAALSEIAQSAGIDKEVELLVKIGEKEAWELGFKATAGTPKVNWRLRIRKFKKV